MPEPDLVKMPGWFVRDVDRDPSRHILAAMIALCRNLRIQSIADGVATQREQDALAGLGCDLIVRA
jgi:EAL domain-containing protein (putative c-di-GMP-specific phosphodiesterase class I)